MKKLLIPALTLVLALILLIACGEATAEKAFINEYDYVGELHNEGLEYVFGELEKLKEKNNLDEENAIKCVKESTIDYVKSISSDIDENKCRAIMDHVYDDVVYSINFTKTISDTTIISDSTLYDSLSENQVILLQELKQIMYNDELKLEDIVNFEKDVELSLNEDEREIIYAFTSVARHSYQYWSESIDEWYHLLSDEEITLGKSTGFWGYLGEVGWKDAIGCVDGAIAGAGLGAIIGSIVPGPGTAAGALAGAGPGAVTGAIGASANKVLTDLYNRLK